MTPDYCGLLRIKLALCYLSCYIVSLSRCSSASESITHPTTAATVLNCDSSESAFLKTGMSHEEYWKQSKRFHWVGTPAQPSSNRANENNHHRASPSAPTPPTYTHNYFSFGLIPYKDRQMGRPESYKMLVPNMIDPLDASLETQGNGSPKQFSATRKLNLLDWSEHTDRCIGSAKELFQRFCHRGTRQTYEYVFKERIKATSQHSDRRKSRCQSKLLLRDLPIAIAQLQIDEKTFWVIRPLNSAPSQTTSPTRLDSFLPRFKDLFAAVDFFHERANQQGLAQRILGVEEAPHGDLITWLLKLIFEQTKESLPLIGSVSNDSFLKKSNPSDHFGKLQKYLSVVLTEHIEDNTGLAVCPAALLLIGYWYQKHATKAEKATPISDSDFWKLMETALRRDLASLRIPPQDPPEDLQAVKRRRKTNQF